jgi:uncharacterized protein YbjT (DUF2867 family)
MAYAVMGITGHVGGAAARELLAKGKKVRALVRDPKKAADWTAKGVELHKGDFDDSAAVAGVLQGVEGAFLMLPPIMAPEPGFPEHRAIIASYVEALRKTPPPRAVALSSIGSEQSSGVGLITSTHLLEEALTSVPFPVAFVRAGSFFENYAGNLGAAQATGVFHSFLQPVGRTFPMIASEDIGKEVAKLLVSEWSGRRIIELGSPLSPDDLAKAMSDVLGKPVVAQAIPREQWPAIVQGFGIPAGRTWAFEEMNEALNSGRVHFGVAGTEPVAATLRPAAAFAEARKG